MAKYMGYVGGAAIAVGVGAAIAVAGQGTAHAESGDAHSIDSSPAKPGPKKTGNKIEKVSAQVNKTVNAVSKSVTDSLSKPAATSKPSAGNFEATQVKKLKSMFTPKQATVAKPSSGESAAKSTTITPKVASTGQTRADTAAADTPAWDPNPFRETDPAPTGFPDAITGLEKALVDVTPDPVKPVAREGVEAAYRVSQMVPWVNVVVPITKIAPSLAPALQGDEAGLAARQTIINQLILTTPPGSLLYYGYDEVADLLNQEAPAQQLKAQAFATVWNILDPFQLAHVTNSPGI